MLIVDAILFWANAKPRHPAIIQPEGVRTYRMLADAIEAAADHFAAAGLDAEKPVAIAIDDPAKMLVASLGLLHAGFSIVPASNAHLEHLPVTRASVLVADRGGLVWPDHETIPFDHAWNSAGSDHHSARSAVAASSGRGGDIIFFTSGTTGRPKMIVHGAAAHELLIRKLKFTLFADFERALVMPWPTGSVGFYRAIEILYAGKTVCYANGGQPMLHLVNAYDIDMIIGSVQQAIALAEIQEKVTHFRLPALKALRVGGGMISRAGIQRLRATLCRNIIVNYASTEAGTTAIAPYDMIEGIPNAVGFVMPGVRIEIVDAMDNLLPIGKEGFVRLQTSIFNTLREARGLDTDAGPKASWFYPGDIGWLTEDGVLCIAGRREDVLNRGGVKIATTDFEDFLKACPGVRDAGVCSVMDSAGFAEIWVGVVLDPGIDMGDFRRYIESEPKYTGNIDKLFVVEELPRGETGKLLRQQLQELLKSIGEES